MLLIGFSWIMMSALAGCVITKVLPGRWEDRGPTVMMLVGVAACFAGMLGIMATEGINAYGPASNMAAATGLGISALGGLIAFVTYVMDVKRSEAQAR
jgi:hypothetical protein